MRLTGLTRPTVIFVAESIDSELPEPDGTRDESNSSSEETQEQTPGLHEEQEASPLGERSNSPFPSSISGTAQFSLAPLELEDSSALIREPSIQTSPPTYSGTFSTDRSFGVSGATVPSFNEPRGSIATTLTPTTTLARRTLNGRVEALLLQHFVNELASWVYRNLLGHSSVK